MVLHEAQVLMPSAATIKIQWRNTFILTKTTAQLLDSNYPHGVHAATGFLVVMQQDGGLSTSNLT